MNHTLSINITLMVRRPSGSLKTAVSRKAADCLDAVRSHPRFRDPGW